MSVLDRVMSLLGLVDRSAEDEVPGSATALEAREDRVLTPILESAALIIARGAEGVRRKEDLVQALRKGRMLVVDLRGLERESGQSLLDFLCGAAFANRGTVIRLAGGVFLAAPRKSMTEEWEEGDGV